ncbi:MAG: hypothetical protein ACRBK7_23710 [Acidimicrobiales bacterium]
MDRRDLVAAVGIGGSTLRPLLSRLASHDLGSEVPIHRQIDKRRGLISLDRNLVSSDVDDLRQLLLGRPKSDTLQAIIELGVLNSPPDLGLIPGHPLTIGLSDELRSLRSRAAEVIAWHELGSDDSANSLLVAIPQPDPKLPELWLAKLDKQAASEGVESARRSLAKVADELGELASGDEVAARDMARLIIETADVRPPQIEPRPSANDQRRGKVVLDGLRSHNARVLFIHAGDVDPSSLFALLRPIRDRFPGAVGTWRRADASAVATVADLIGTVVADQIRRPASDLPQRLIVTLLAIAEGRPLEPDSTARWFARDAMTVLQAWSGGDPPLVLIGRAAAGDADLDRLLADLLRLDGDLRVVVLHSESEDAARAVDEPSPFDDFLSAKLVVSPRPDATDSLLLADAQSSQPKESLEQVELARLAPVVALAVGEDGRLHRALAAHLLDAVGSVVDPHRVLDAVERSGLLDREQPSPPGGFDDNTVDGNTVDGNTVTSNTADRGQAFAGSPGELRWLGTAGLQWLTAGRLIDDADISLLRLLVERVGPRDVPVGLCAELLSLAEVSVSYGDLSRGKALLDVAVTTAGTNRARAEALAQRGDCHRDGGDWAAALIDYRSAIALLSDDDDDGRIAYLVLRMARLTWDPAVGDEVDVLLRATLARLAPEETMFRARLELCLAGGSFQDGSAGAERLDPAGVLAALDVTSTSLDPEARAWGFLHARKALLGVASVDRSAEWAQEIVDNGLLDIALLAQGHQALFVDNIRRGDWPRAERALRRVVQLARTPTSAEQKFSTLVAQTCWDLASGELEGAAQGLAAAEEFRSQLGGSTFNQVTLGQTVWLARAHGNQEELQALASAAAGLADSEPGGEIWMAGAALLAVEVGRYSEAADRVVNFARRSGGFGALRPGAHRLPVLAIAAIVAAHAAVHEPSSPFTDEDIREIETGLANEQCAVVLIGWPTAILGPIDQFRALVLALLGHHQEAALAQARADRFAEGLGAMQEQGERLGGLVRLIDLA